MHKLKQACTSLGKPWDKILGMLIHHRILWIFKLSFSKGDSANILLFDQFFFALKGKKKDSQNAFPSI